MGRRLGMVALTATFWMLSLAGAVRADIVIQVDKSSQRMSVSVNGQHRYTWAVSTGIYGTPSGTFRPQGLSRNHRSSLYHNAPMPYSIFYDGNFAIHGTTHVSRLGGPASRGCVRPMRRSCSRWCREKAWAIPASRSSRSQLAISVPRAACGRRCFFRRT
jgi:hypothetical protein